MEKQKKTWETPEGTLSYVTEEGESQRWVRIINYSGTDVKLHIPETIEELPVRVLAKKTFLSRKQLRKVILPMTLEEIGDWAFTYCTNLESVWLPKKEMKLGNRIFMECPEIRRIYTYEAGIKDAEIEKMLDRRQENGKSENGEVSEDDQRAALLAAGTLMLDAEYLMNPAEAGSKEWIRKWDARMNEILDLDDSEGYTKMILCGEEDYGTNIDEFIRNKRKSKVRLAFLRLMNPLALSAANEEKLKEYLTAHTKGCVSEESWEVLLKEYGHKQEYVQLFTDIGGVNEKNFDLMLADIPSEYAEMKAFLIRYKAENMEKKDFFAALSLDDL